MDAIEYITVPVLKSIFSHLNSEQISTSLATLNKSISSVTTKLVDDNSFWKKMVETLIGFYIPENAVRDWRSVYNVLKIETTNHLVTAAKCGYIEIIQLYVDTYDPSVLSPAADNNLAIQLACRGGHVGVVKLLLADPRVDPTVENNLPFMIACVDGHIEVVKLLLEDDRINPSDSDSYAIITAASHGYFDLIKVLLQVPSISPATKHNTPLEMACANGHINVAKLLITDRRVNANDEGRAFAAACFNRNIDIIKLLLNTPGVDPAYNRNRAFRKACANRHMEVIELLLADPRIDPSDKHNRAFRKACDNNYTDIVEMLIKDPRVDPSDENNEAISTACFHGNIPIIKLLLSDLRVDPTDNNNEAFLIACEYIHTDVVAMLLAFSRERPGQEPLQIDPSVHNNEALVYAAEKNVTEIMAMLISDPRVDPSARKNTVLNICRVFDNKVMIDLLLDHNKIVLVDKESIVNRVLPNEWLSATLDELSSASDLMDLLSTGYLSFTSEQLYELVNTKYFWWARLERLHRVPSSEIIAMDIKTNPYLLCVKLEK